MLLLFETVHGLDVGEFLLDGNQVEIEKAFHHLVNEFKCFLRARQNLVCFPIRPEKRSLSPSDSHGPTGRVKVQFVPGTDLGRSFLECISKHLVFLLYCLCTLGVW